jgi:Flp pilus assembly protein TadD
MTRAIAAAKTAAWRQTSSRQTIWKQLGAGALSLFVLGCAGGPFGDKPEAQATETPAQAAKASAIDKAPADLDSAIAQAQANRRSGDLAASARTLSQLVIFLPDEPRVLGEYGKTLAAMGRSDDALAFLERAIQLSPGDWSLVSAQGVAFDQKGNFAAAQESYRRALLLQPGEPTVLNNAALSRMQAGDLDGAERLLLQAAPGTAEYPRIAENLTLVQNLKQARAEEKAAPVDAAPVAPPPIIVQSQPPAPAPFASLQTPKEPAEGTNVSSPSPQSSPATTAALPPPAMIASGAETEPAGVSFSANSNSANSSSAPKPERTVVMAALPKASQEEAAAHTAAARAAASVSPSAMPVVADEKPSGHASAAPKPEKPAPTVLAANKSPIYVQAGAYASEMRAGELAASLDRLGARVSPINKDGHAIYRVRIGPFLNVDQANAAITQAHALGHPDVKIVSD